MRIITPTGKLYEVFRVEPCVEKKEAFNGRVHRNVEVAANMSMKPTGLRCVLKRSYEDFSESYVYVGNLTPEKLQEIIRTMLKDGFYDFTKLNYQKLKVVDFFDDAVIDGGTSLPYYNEHCSDSIFNRAFSCTSSLPANNEFDSDVKDDEECFEDDEECSEGAE